MSEPEETEKLFFTREAALYAGVSEATFRARAKKLGLKPVLMNRSDNEEDEDVPF